MAGAVFLFCGRQSKITEAVIFIREKPTITPFGHV